MKDKWHEPDPMPSEVTDWDFSIPVMKQVAFLAVAFLIGAIAGSLMVYWCMM